jgi:hypothetical protein
MRELSSYRPCALSSFLQSRRRAPTSALAANRPTRAFGGRRSRPPAGAPLRILVVSERRTRRRHSNHHQGSKRMKSCQPRARRTTVQLCRRACERQSRAPCASSSYAKTARPSPAAASIVAPKDTPRPPAPRYAGAWRATQEWSRATENFFSAWIERMFDAPAGSIARFPVAGAGAARSGSQLLVGLPRPARRRPQESRHPARRSRLRRSAVLPARLFRVEARLALCASRLRPRQERSTTQVRPHPAQRAGRRHHQGGRRSRTLPQLSALLGQPRAFRQRAHRARRRRNRLLSRRAHTHGPAAGHDLRRSVRPCADGGGLGSQTAEHGGLLLAVDGQPDNSVGRKRFWEGTFLFANDVKSAGPGFKAFRPIVRGQDKALALAQQRARIGSAFCAVFHRASPPRSRIVLRPRGQGYQPVGTRRARGLRRDHERARRAAHHAHRFGRQRRALHARARTTPSCPCPSKPKIFETTGPWEDYATPSRDMRLLIALRVLTGLPARIIEHPELFVLGGRKPAEVRAEIEALHEKQIHERAIAYQRSDGSTFRLTVADILARRARPWKWPTTPTTASRSAGAPAPGSARFRHLQRHFPTSSARACRNTAPGFTSQTPSR